MKSIGLLLLGSILFIACKTEKPPVFDILIKNINIVDTYTGKVINGQTIGINNDTIAQITSFNSAKNWTGNQTINAKDKFIIPGLWDMHVHFGGGDTLIAENKNLLPLYIANGVTTVRDCAADISPSVLKWKKEIQEGTLLGPYILTSGPKLEGKNSIWPGDLEIENEKELGQALDSLDKLKVDFVKITDNALSPELFLKSIKEATIRGYKTSGHTPFELTISEVSNAGLTTIEHMGYMLKAASSQEDEIIKDYKNGKLSYAEAQSLLTQTFDTAAAIAKYKKLSSNGTGIVPTLIGSRITSYLDQNNHLSDPELKYLGPGLIKTYDWRVNRANKASQEAIESRHKKYKKMVSLLPLIQQSGMKIIAGTDAGFLNSYIYPGFALHEELQIFVEGGLSPLQALQTSVINGPKYFGLTAYYGNVEKGKVANLLILNSNPINDIKATKDIYMLIKKLKVYNRTMLDELLKKLASEYEKEIN
ncbi:amidohydrolase family protein [Aestuariivivens insulae]|uniref:amidohydrolase family protein n=1 Tax=Aestuariivivens insulae TaxID=1621988 RepID=UPI001F5775C1|nr:amidohydrolase family protein [Aestuariivivens insulae]